LRLKSGVHAYVLSCSQTEAGSGGFFVQMDGCPMTVERCVSLRGKVVLGPKARVAIRGSSFGRGDWLSYSTLRPGQIELEDVQYGGTPNSRGFGPSGRIDKQRITSAGISDYALSPAG
jgi:hypothetical protein